MILSKDTWYYIVEQQKILDEAFMKNAKWDPDTEDRETALRIEKAEFANEFPEKLKWWKHKKDDRLKILDEYVDILHFMAGIAVQRNPVNVKLGSNEYFWISDSKKRKWKKYTVEHLLQKLVKTKNVYKAVALATYILEREGFIDAEIREAYDTKNAENFERIAAGY